MIRYNIRYVIKIEYTMKRNEHFKKEKHEINVCNLKAANRKLFYLIAQMGFRSGVIFI